MSTSLKEHSLLLAISPSAKGFGFAVFEGPQEPVDWGVKDVRGDKNRGCLKKLEELIEFYEPDTLVFEKIVKSDNRRRPRIQQLLRQMKKLGVKKKKRICNMSHAKVRETFSRFEANTKYDIAKAITTFLPELEPRLPRHRKPWMNEDYRMGIFDAVALALTYFYVNE